MKAGFIGLGTLGKTIAKRLISEGVKLTVWNRTKEKAQDLEAEWAENPAELISQTDIVFLCLFDSAAVAEVTLGDKGLLSGNPGGKIIIDNTTNHFEPVLSFHTMFRENGAFYVEAPVLGSVVPASQGNLTVLASGERSAYDAALPFIQKIGKAIFYLGEPGLATKMKLINNLILGSFMATIAEATVFGEAVGLNREKILDIFAAGAGNSMVLNAKREKLIKEDFSTHFSSALIYKDLHFLQDLAKSLRRPLFTGSAVKELFGMTLSKDIDHLDFSGVYKVLKEW
ncbi:MAG: NAD(P)-dependent oxidoreductase [Deltaproteobacteria bacterium]